MPRDSSGNYTLATGNPVAAGTIIQSIWANATMDDIATALSDSLDRYGRGGMLAPFYFTDGVQLAPGASFTNEKTSGLYREALGDVRMVVITENSMRWQSTGVQAWDVPDQVWRDVLTKGGEFGVTEGTVESQTLRWDNSTLRWIPSSALLLNIPAINTPTLKIAETTEANATDIAMTGVGLIGSGGRGDVVGTGDFSWWTGATNPDRGVAGATVRMNLSNAGDLNLIDGDITTTGDISGTNLFGNISNTTGAPNAPNGMPAGGTAGQIIEKQSGTDYDTDWVDKTSFTGWFVGEIKGFSGNLNTLPAGWHLCDGTNGTPDLRGRMLFAEGGSFTDGVFGGAMPSTGTANSAGAHTHTGSAASNGNHSHTITVNNGGNHSHTITVDNAGSHLHATATPEGGEHAHTLFSVPRSTGFGTDYNFEAITENYTGTQGLHTHPSTVSGTAGTHGHAASNASAGTHSHTASSNSTGAHTHTTTANSNGAHTHTTTAPDLPPYYVMAGWIMYLG